MSDPISFVVNAERAEVLASMTEEALATNHARAEMLARQLIEIMRILHGPCHIEVGVALFYLALALEEQGKLAEALDTRRQARKILLGQGLSVN